MPLKDLDYSTQVISTALTEQIFQHSTEQNMIFHNWVNCSYNDIKLNIIQKTKGHNVNKH